MKKKENQLQTDSAPKKKDKKKYWLPCCCHCSRNNWSYCYCPVEILHLILNQPPLLSLQFLKVQILLRVLLQKQNNNCPQKQKAMFLLNISLS